jgi:hypothetical protein
MEVVTTAMQVGCFDLGVGNDLANLLDHPLLGDHRVILGTECFECSSGRY